MITSPVVVLSCGYVLLIIISISSRYIGLYTDNEFFQWGPPITIINFKITSDAGFWVLWFVYFIHQLMNTWVSEVVYPWIINEVQDPKANSLRYSRVGSIMLVNLHAIYSTLDMIFIVNGAISQVSLLAAIIFSNVICVTIVNWRYLSKKDGFAKIDQVNYSIV
jgi:hypothetical protein